MDPATVERLQKLQMADLGTARREYISTADNKDYDRIRLEDIEASRLSNIKGSEAQRLAQVNKEHLNKWSNMYKEVGDADDLEELDDLMHGQSHRAELSAKVHSAGGQTYSKTTKKNDNYLKLSHAKSLRSAQSSGRGGGVIGTRGRASQSNVTRQVDGAFS
ncbi:hypothetical protein PHISCL_03513 [Aspergillus sclerotialis]|uniref:Uncharacterized protein n=1 Tax=Aspergillus sclerotialis TaxID=2070753 RepID=A0A3A2ZLP7_9EURO|nr:hypothetical protein PHISCL_03513 [Aspergillus sclerotialis]